MNNFPNQIYSLFTNFHQNFILDLLKSLDIFFIGLFFLYTFNLMQRNEVKGMEILKFIEITGKSSTNSRALGAAKFSCRLRTFSAQHILPELRPLRL